MNPANPSVRRAGKPRMTFWSTWTVGLLIVQALLFLFIMQLVFIGAGGFPVGYIHTVLAGLVAVVIVVTRARWAHALAIVWVLVALVFNFPNIVSGFTLADGWGSFFFNLVVTPIVLATAVTAGLALGANRR